MKKVLLLAIFISFFFANKIKALEYYENINIATYFEENIDLENIDSIFIKLENYTGNAIVYELERKNDYKLNINDFLLGNIRVDYVNVFNDNYGIYPIDYEIINVNEKNITIKLIVSYSSNSSSNVVIPSHIQEEMQETENKGINVITNNTIKDKETTVPKVTTTLEQSTQMSSNGLKENKKNNNNKVILIVLFVAGIIIILVIIYVIIKISSSNK